MKRKILAIALSLALLSSLFVFASPVSSAKSEEANSFEIWFTYVPGSNQPYTMDYSEWYGKPLDITLPLGPGGPPYTITVPGQFNDLGHEWLFTGLGDFGPDIGLIDPLDIEIYVRGRINYNVPTARGDWDWDMVTDVGVLSLRVNTKRTTGFWFDINPEDPHAYWPAVDYHWHIVSGTGAFENMIGAGKWNPDTSRYEGIAHYNPRD